ncbi:invasion associated locus B family protein [Ciceribacter sp. L1K23]|uniref:invasion associated locus B family protein n=1 Tax=Ciceribacter sp. L1K23 TaxID=2820276 RepID=UPI001B83A643|nr:invasion associated locus B family protein [Ciceribacter sp. L1K23]MBR0555574.1 invasion associated locus B family protein [Ciceribacter sp. L1K23]
MFEKMTPSMRMGLSALAFAFAAGAAPVATAQEAAPAGAPPQGWFKTCSKQEESDVCVVQNQVIAQNGQLITAVGLISLEGKVNRKILQVTVPSARLIPPGIGMQIDGGNVQKIDYAVCLPDRCTAEIPLTDAIIASLKKGGEVVFTSINVRRAPNPIKISLSGFTGAYDGEAITQNQAEERQRLLQEQMQKKAEESRKALEQAQDAAKQGQ